MFEWIGDQIGKIIWNNLLMWLYETIYQAAADFFAMMGNMGAEIFDLSWVAAVVQLFSLFGWALFGIGMVTAVFDAAIEYQNGRGNLNMTALNVLKGFFAASMVGVLPIELYRFSISLQNTLSGELLGIFTADGSGGFSGKVVQTLSGNFLIEDLTEVTLLAVLILIAFAYAITKVFFQNIKRGGILLVQIAVGSMYLFSVPRGYTDGFIQWTKQIIALCLTAFLQTTLLMLGLMTFPGKQNHRYRHHACSRRSAAHCRAVWNGYLGKDESDERSAQCAKRHLSNAHVCKTITRGEIYEPYLPIPKKLKEKANLWLWSLRDFAILSVALLFSALALAKLGILLPLGISLGFAFLTIRLSAYTMLEYISWCMRFFSYRSAAL